MTATSWEGRIWVHSLRPSGSPGVEEVASLLRQAGLNAEPPSSGGGSAFGVVIACDVTQELVDLVAEASGGGSARVLVLVSGSAEASDVWRLLAAGASDVLHWERLVDPEAALTARFMRWLEVEELVHLPLVKNHLVGESPVWIATMRRVIEAARFSDSPILLMGETGTGKELVARLMHTVDPRRSKGEVVILDCTTIVPDLAGSELFGHERGAFTGAVSARDGAFSLADGGTLFLDEVGELPASLQVQLLRVLQEKTYKKVGGNSWHHADFRLICATNRDLRVEEAEGRFRRDLYYRVATLVLTMPSLRDRVSDILPLARHFMAEAREGTEPPEMDDAVKLYVMTRRYPGNVRDLRNLIYRVMARYPGSGPVTVGDLPPEERPQVDFEVADWAQGAFESAVRQAFAMGIGLKELRRAVEEAAVRIAVQDERGNLQRAAQRLAVTDRALQKRRAEQVRQRGSAA
jgi:DNA-binding NtrC family response regulator